MYNTKPLILTMTKNIILEIGTNFIKIYFLVLAVPFYVFGKLIDDSQITP